MAALFLGEILCGRNHAVMGLKAINILTFLAAVIFAALKLCFKSVYINIIRLFRIRNKRYLFSWCIILVMTFNMGYYIGNECNKNIYSAESAFKDNERVRICGRIDNITIKTNGIYYYLKNANVSGKNKTIFLKHIILCVKSKINSGDIGKTIDTYANYSEFGAARNDGGFDEKKYYYEQGVYGRFKAENEEKINTYGKNARIKHTLFKVKCRCISVINRTCNKKYSGIYAGILLGEKSQIDEGTKELYKLSGISHLLAISGLHISLIGYFIYKRLRKFLSLIPAGIISFVIIGAYAEMVGGSVSAKRAVIMFGLNLMAQVIGRSYDTISSLGMAFLIVIISNPLIIYNSGMLLSFGAIIGITIISNPICSLLKVSNKIMKSFLASVSIDMVTKPVIAYFYYEVSTYSSLINIIIIPFMSIVAACGFIGIIIGLVSIPLGKVFMQSGCLILKMYDIVCRLFIKLPYADKITGRPETKIIIIYFVILVICIAGIYIYLHKWEQNNDIDTYKVRVIKRTSICMMVLMLSLILFIQWNKEFRVQMIDVGQGDSICINDGENVILVDAGSSSEKNITKYTILPFLKANGIEEIDYMIMTHSDSDHISGMNDLMDFKYNGSNYVKNLVLPNINEGVIDENYQEILNKAKEEGVNILLFGEGDVMKFDGMELKCIWPEKSLLMDKNDLSVTFYLNIGKFRMLFTGDLGEAGEKQLSAIGMLEDIDVLKVGHHGSNGSSAESFLCRLKPELSVVSCGINNRYGHPGKETISRLNDIGTDIFVTKDCGQIDIIFKEKGFMVETFLY